MISAEQAREVLSKMQWIMKGIKNAMFIHNSSQSWASLEEISNKSRSTIIDGLIFLGYKVTKFDEDITKCHSIVIQWG